MKKAISILFVIIAILLSISCNKNKINQKTILELGKVKITDYEFNRELKRFKSQYADDNKALEKFTLNYIDNLFFIADAFALSYDTIESINSKVKATADIMMVQTYGYLWQHNCSAKIDKARNITKEKLAKRNNIYYFDYVEITDTCLFNKSALNQFSVRNKTDYDQLKGICNQYPFLETNYALFQWPFFFFNGYGDDLVKMVPGEVLGPLNVIGKSYYVYLDHVEDTKASDENISIMQTELQQIEEHELDVMKTQEMIEKGEPELYEQNLTKLFDFIVNGGELMDYDENYVLLKYNLYDSINYVDVLTIKSYLSVMPFSMNIKTRIELEEIILQYYYNKYLIKEAIELGLYQTVEFLLDQKNFKNKLILNQYLMDSVNNKVDIDSAQINNYYQNHMQDYILENVSVVDLLYLKNIEKSKEILGELSNNLNEHIKANYIGIKDLVEIKNDVILNLVSISMPQLVIQDLAKLSENECYSQIVESNGEYLLIVKRRNLNDYQPKLEQIRNKIYQELFVKQLELIKERKLNALKSTYKLTINKTGIPY